MIISRDKNNTPCHINIYININVNEYILSCIICGPHNALDTLITCEQKRL